MAFPRNRLAALTMLALLLMALAPAWALSPQVRLHDYQHISWRVKDGMPTEIGPMAQTPDGWLWLGTSNGLFRFDGVRAERYPLPDRGAVPRERIRQLIARANGELWIVFEDAGLAVLRKDGTLEDVPLAAGMGAPETLAIAGERELWTVTAAGLFHYSGGHWQQLANRPHPSPHDADWSLLVDQRQRLWVANPQGVFLLDRASGVLEARAVRHGGSLSESPDGAVWLIDQDDAQRLSDAADAGAPRAADFNQRQAGRLGQFDRDGNLWAMHCPLGVCFVAADAVAGAAAITPSRQARDKLDQTWQLSGLHVNSLLEDREGDIWIAHQTGLELFRENKLVSAHIPVPFGRYTMASDGDGHVWAADPVRLTAWRLDNLTAPVADPQRYAVVANDRDGALLLAGRRTLERRDHGRVTDIALPPDAAGHAADLQVRGLLDDGAVLWLSTVETGLSGLVDGRWRPAADFGLPADIALLRPAGKGQLWLARADGSLVFYDHGRLSRYGAAGVGAVTEIHAGAEVLVAGSGGLALLRGPRFLPLQAADPAVLRGISGIAVTPDGDRWLNGGRGIVHVRSADWQQAVAGADTAAATPLRYELIGMLDGYPGQAMLQNHARSIYAAPDGQLWFMSSRDIARLDVRRQRANTAVPHVEIERLLAGGRSYPARPPLRLPPASSSFSIDFTAPMLSKPELVRFQYQLVGVDAGWQDAGARRVAYYTNVGPGQYRFRVRASNEDGVASEGEAQLALEIAPTVGQTLWFKALCGAGGAALLYLLYLYRLDAATARVAERLHVRMAERERIARALHDTVLQSVQAITLRLDLVARELPPGDAIRAKLDALLDQADRAYVEGRDQVHELRAGQGGDVDSAIADAGQQMMLLYPDTAFALDVSGQPQRLHSQVAEEVCEIGREALRNAFQHASASKVSVTLAYAPDQLALTVRDDGCGIADARVCAAPAPHWGLVGMRERAARIGARLKIDSAAGAGTQVALTVPGRLAYAGRRRWPRWRWFR